MDGKPAWALCPTSASSFNPKFRTFRSKHSISNLRFQNENFKLHLQAPTLAEFCQIFKYGFIPIASSWVLNWAELCPWKVLKGFNHLMA